MSIFKDERERERETIKHRTPPPNEMFMQLVGIPVSQDRSGVVMIGKVPIPPCSARPLRGHHIPHR